MLRCLIAAIAVCLAAGVTLPAQSTIAGALREQRGDSLFPVPNCVVFARSAEHGPLVGEYSGEKGRFLLAFPPDPRVSVGVDCPGYRLISIDGRQSAMSTYDCSQPGPCVEVELTLEPLAVIEGHVLDPNGMPVEDVRLGLRPLEPSTRGRGSMGVSDDRGYFRIFHLLPGSYELQPISQNALGASGRWETDPVRIDLSPGDIHSGVQVQLRLLESVPFSGRIEGLPPGTTQVYLSVTSRQGGLQGSMGFQSQVDEQGRFHLENLSPGQYDVELGLPDSEGSFERMTRTHIGAIDLTAASGEAVFSSRRPVQLKGALDVEWPETDALPMPAEGSPLFLNLVREDGFRQGSSVRPPDYRFDIHGLRPGRYQLTLSGPGAKLERLIREGEWEPIREISLDEGDDIELALRVRFEFGSLTVQVRPTEARYVVGIRSNGRTRLFPTDQNGLLVLDLFPSGQYEICAWPDIGLDEANDPQTWRKAGEAVREFTHDEGVAMEMTLTAAP